VASLVRQVWASSSEREATLQALVHAMADPTPTPTPTPTATATSTAEPTVPASAKPPQPQPQPQPQGAGLLMQCAVVSGLLG
jgi:hypothetical protein